jgi:hypothetical protein
MLAINGLKVIGIKAIGWENRGVMSSLFSPTSFTAVQLIIY